MSTLWETIEFVCSLQFWRMSLLWTFSLLYSYFQLWFSPCKSHSYPRCFPSNTTATTRPVCIITGATSGLGAAAACELSSLGFYVVLAGRSAEHLSKTVIEIEQQHPDAHLKAFQVDVTSFSSMLQFKNNLQQWLLDSDMHTSIQLLINNAGILATSHRLTAEGYDQMAGTNYMGAFVLTSLLLPLLKRSFIPSRIINVTSFTHRCVTSIQVDEETLVGKHSGAPTSYQYAKVYEYSKVCILLFSYELHRQLHLVDTSNRVSVIAADPGAVETNIMREIPSHLSRLAMTVLNLFGLLDSPQNGVYSILDAALAPPEISGEYFFGGNGRTIKSSSLSHNTKLAAKLWSSSCSLFSELQLAHKEEDQVLGAEKSVFLGSRSRMEEVSVFSPFPEPLAFRMDEYALP